MILALSSEAAPHASVDELVEGAARRGINALHLVFEDAKALQAATPRSDVQVIGITVRSIQDLSALDATEASLRLRAPFVVPAVSEHWRNVFADHKAMLIANYELNAARQDVAAAYASVLMSGARVQHITLRGGGPEGVHHEGCGIGTLMARLAVNGYHGSLVLAPSSRAALPLWRTWLHHGRNWGCGSKQQDHSLVQLG